MSLIEKLLLEISLDDHYEKYVDKNLLSKNDYLNLAELDPTSKNQQRGKYQDFLIKIIKTDSNYPDVQSLLRKEDEIYDGLELFFNTRKGDINQFKTLDSFLEFSKTIPPSGKESKRESKSLYGKPDDIEMLDDTGKYYIFQTHTRKGNIIGAQFKTNPQSDWCTAYLDTDSHWRGYSRKGDLIQIINKKDPYEKYQVFIEDGEVTEARDYKDNTSDIPQDILEQSDEFEKNYGKIKVREELKIILDEEGAAQYYLNDEFNESEYTNRPPTDEEYEYMYETPIEWQIHHWDRVMREGWDIYKNEIERIERYRAYHKKNGNEYHDYRTEELEDRLDRFVDFFYYPPTELQEMADDAKEAVYDFFDTIDEKMKEDYISTEEDESDRPKEYDYKDRDLFIRDLEIWKKEVVDEFLKDYSVELQFCEKFQEKFQYEFYYETFLRDVNGFTGRDNSEDQLEFDFNDDELKINDDEEEGIKLESSFSNLLKQVLKEEEELSDLDTMPEETEEELSDLDTMPEETEEEMSDLDFPSEEEEVEVGTCRLYTFDRKNINYDLRELYYKKPSDIFPINNIKELLNKKNIDFDIESVEMERVDGNVDIDIYLNGKAITNSKLVLYWSKTEDDMYNINAYLSAI